MFQPKKVDNGKAVVNGFLPDEYLFLTTYDCTMKGGRKEKVLLSAILEPSDVKVRKSYNPTLSGKRPISSQSELRFPASLELRSEASCQNISNFDS